jgi:hypothetical protein
VQFKDELPLVFMKNVPAEQLTQDVWPRFA